MSKAIITEGLLTDIADAIRAKNGAVATYTPAQMAAAIAALQTTVQFPAQSGYGQFWNVLAPLVDMSQVTDMYGIMRQGGSIQNVHLTPDISGWDVSNVVNMNSAFYYAGSSNYFNPDFSGWDVGSCGDFGYMFYFCNGSIFNPAVEDWDMSSAVILSYMFGFCRGAAFNPDVTGWDVSHVQMFNGLFNNCSGSGMRAFDLDGWTNTLTGVHCNTMFGTTCNSYTKKLWWPSTFKPTYSEVNEEPFTTNPGSRGLHVFTDAANATTMGWTTINSNYTMHYNATHADFLAYTV